MLTVAYFLTLLCLFFLTAAIIEVQMVRGNLQTTRNNRHDGDELTVFRQNQFFFLALVFSLHPDSMGKSSTFTFSALHVRHNSEGLLHIFMVWYFMSEN